MSEYLTGLSDVPPPRFWVYWEAFYSSAFFKQSSAPFTSWGPARDAFYNALNEARNAKPGPKGEKAKTTYVVLHGEQGSQTKWIAANGTPSAATLAGPRSAFGKAPSFPPPGSPYEGSAAAPMSSNYTTWFLLAGGAAVLLYMMTRGKR